MKGIIVVDIPECCIKTDGSVKCPLAWNSQFCSSFSPKGLDMTNGEWEEIYMTGEKPDWCPIKPVPKKFKKETVLHGMDEIIQESSRRGWNACINEILRVEENE